MYSCPTPPYRSLALNSAQQSGDITVIPCSCFFFWLLSQLVLFNSVMFAQLLQKQLQLPSNQEAIRHNGGNKAGSCAESLCHPPSHPSIPLFFQGLRHTTLSLTSFHTVCSHAWPADFSGSVYLAWLQLADGAAAACRQSLTDVWRHGVGFML